MNTRDILIHALTAYDRRQSTKRGYNYHALPLYFERIDDVMADVARGADLRKALCAGFTGAVLGTCLRALKLGPVSADEFNGTGSLTYKPETK